MSSSATGRKTAVPLYRAERIIASLTVAWVLGLTTYMIFQDHALSIENTYFLKIVLSLSGGVMLATLPGFFDLNYAFGGSTVRVAGGAAAFIFIFTQSPTLPSLDGMAEREAPAMRVEAKPRPRKSTAQADATPAAQAVSLARFEPGEARRRGWGAVITDRPGTHEAERQAKHHAPSVDGQSRQRGDGQRLGALSADLQRAARVMLGNVSQAVGGAVASTDRTMKSLQEGLRKSTGALLSRADRLPADMKEMLSGATGGMSDKIAPPVETLAQRASGTTGKVAETVLPKATRAARLLLDHVDTGFEQIAETLNHLAPAIDADGLQHDASPVPAALRGPAFVEAVYPFGMAQIECISGCTALGEGQASLGTPLIAGGQDADGSPAYGIGGGEATGALGADPSANSRRGNGPARARR